MISPRQFARNASKSGVALVIVLAMLVMLSALLVAFMTTATTERTAVSAAGAGAAARHLSDSTVNLVIGQIRDATSQSDKNATWASQPGAIRTYTGTLSRSKKQLNAHGSYYWQYVAGANDFVYKLYSSDEMKVSSGSYPEQLKLETDVIESWKREDPDPEYVDLNEPVLSPRLDLDPAGTTVEPHYPIIDPRAAYTVQGAPSPGGTDGIVEGFDANIVKDESLFFPGPGGTKGTQSVPYIPMPVKWLYVMRDGTVGPTTMATVENPIVGRTAFWVDDESAKLNINTASEGTFWDTPHVSNEQESGRIPGVRTSNQLNSTLPTVLSLASSQPSQREYQRFPGHPATTSLSPVLGFLWNVTSKTDVYPRPTQANNPYTLFKEAIYQISPFTPSGEYTTRGATKNPEPEVTRDEDPDYLIGTKHLYATVDELLFKSERYDRSDEPLLNDRLTPEALEKTRFFLTANGRAPDLNLFGRPRVTLWPIHTQHKFRTSFDDLFAFASTISRNPDPTGYAGDDELKDRRYFLTRYDSRSDVNDFQEPTYQGESQNQRMYRYLQWLTGRDNTGQAPEVPGFGGRLVDKYGIGSQGILSGVPERDQILTMIFDYARTVNLVDTGTASRRGNEFAPYTPRFFEIGYREDYERGARSNDWSGQVTPIKIGNTRGMGRFVTIVEAALIFNRVRPTDMRASLVLEMATPMAGFPTIRETYFTRMTTVRPTMIGELNIGFPGTAENWSNVPSHEITDGRGYMPLLGFTASMHYFPLHKGPTFAERYIFPNKDPNRNISFTVAAKRFDRSGAPHANYPYVSDLIPVAATAREFTFNGGAFDIEIWTGESPLDPRKVKVQTVHLDFGSEPVTVPVPTGSGEFHARFPNPMNPGANRDPIQSGDVIRSLELTTEATGDARGDLRLAMALDDVPSTYFQRRDPPLYSNKAQRQVHGLQHAHGEPASGHTGPGKIAHASANPRNKHAMIPRGIQGVNRADGGPGDWDRGLSKHMDGAMGNKVDEGNTRFRWEDQWGEAGKIPYFRGRGIEETGQSYFSPNRQLPSPVMLGSIPTGVVTKKPWQTLLFRPDREIGPGHPGANIALGPPDHLWLDLFHLPVVEPYAISEPFSTAGKVNLNHVIAPFGYAKGAQGNNPGTATPRSYLRRDTALRGLLKSTFTTAVPTGMAEGGHAESPIGISIQSRFPIDLNKTIELIDGRINDQRVAVDSRDMTLFRSPSEICEIDLYPKNVNITNWGAYWDNANAATGDNMRERPYAHIYPRVTTRSNVFTVHMRCQAIKKSPKSDPTEFDEEKDQVVGEYRGSAMIERYIDPNDPALATYDERKSSVDPYYKYRVISTKHFSPK